MSVHSASAHHTTADFHREPKWDPPRRAFGITGLCISGAGLGIFIYYFSTHLSNPTVTGHAIGWAALAVTLTPCGLIVARWGFGSQRATDTKRAFVEDLLAVITRVDDLTEKVDELRALTARAIHESKAAEEEKRPDVPAATATQQHAPRQRKRRRQGSEPAGKNVIPLRARGAADALRRLTEHVKGETDA